jgi:sugar lactone lactonase YvrE
MKFCSRQIFPENFPTKYFAKEFNMNTKHRFLLICLALIAALLVSGMASGSSISKGTVSHIKVKILARGSPIHGSNGLYFGPDGNLYIASFPGREIIKMNPNSGRILDRIGPERGVDSPDDLIFGEDGSLYWTVLLTGEIGKLAPDGTKSTLVQLGPGTNPITINDEGRMFVGQAFMGDSLYEVYLDGREPRLIIAQTNSINAFDFGPDGYLYAPSPSRGLVVRINVENGEMTTIARGMEYPAAVKFNSTGQLFALDQPTGEVFKINIQTGSKKLYARLDNGIDNLAFNSQGRMFVSNADEGYIAEIFPNGHYRLVSPGGMIAPGGVAVLPDDKHKESVYVADLFTLRQFDSRTGKQLSHMHKSWIDPLALNPPITVSPDGNNLMLSSFVNNTVQVWDPENRQVIVTYPGFTAPLNAIRFQGDPVVSELGTGRVVRETPGGRVTLAQLAVPTGLAGSGDNLWAADWAMGKVFQLVAGGVVLPEPISVASGLAFPEGLAVGPDGNLLVVETGTGSLLHINLVNGVVTTLASNLQLGMPAPVNAPPTWFFNGVAVGPSGTIYVTGDIANVLYRIHISWK